MKLQFWQIGLIILLIGTIIYLAMSNMLQAAILQLDGEPSPYPDANTGGGFPTGGALRCDMQLRKGSTGQEVLMLQQWYNDQPWAEGSELSEDGVFGPMTEAAVSSLFPGNANKRSTSLTELNICS